MTARREDDDLVRRARGGDEAAWAELYRRHAGRLLVWLRTLSSGDVAASPEDVASDAWITATQRLSSFSGTADDFGGWLFSIARNVASNRRRTTVRRATSPHAVDSPHDAHWGASPDHAPGVDHAHWVRQVLARLSSREAEVVACMDVVGLDAAATAVALGMSQNAVRVTRHRALRRLRAVLTEETSATADRPAPRR